MQVVTRKRKSKYLIITVIAVVSILFLLSKILLNQRQIDENSITVKLLDVSLTKVSYEKVILLNSFDENDNKELEKLQVPISEMPSGVYLKELGIKDSSEVMENTKVSIFDIGQKYTDSSDRRYVFKTWEDFVSATKDDEALLKGRFYIISFKDNKINRIQEKLYL